MIRLQEAPHNYLTFSTPWKEEVGAGVLWVA